jgi:hypothetical protein
MRASERRNYSGSMEKRAGGRCPFRAMPLPLHRFDQEPIVHRFAEPATAARRGIDDEAEIGMPGTERVVGEIVSAETFRGTARRFSVPAWLAALRLLLCRELPRRSLLQILLVAGDSHCCR